MGRNTTVYFAITDDNFDFVSMVQGPAEVAQRFSGVNQRCFLAPTLFGISLALMLKHVFRCSTEGEYKQRRSGRTLLNFVRLKFKSAVPNTCLGIM